MDLSKQQVFDADPKAIQNLDQTELWYWHNIKFSIRCDW